VPSLRVSHYSKLRAPVSDIGSSINSISNSNKGISNRGQQLLLAGKLVIYHAEPKNYSAFISPEVCVALDKYLEFRREHGEQINDFSSIFRDKFDLVEALDSGELSNNNNSSYSDMHSFPSAGTTENETKIDERRTSKDTVIMPMSEHSINHYYNTLLTSGLEISR
jgi:hypothetical protein